VFIQQYAVHTLIILTRYSFVIAQLAVWGQHRMGIKHDAHQNSGISWRPKAKSSAKSHSVDKRKQNVDVASRQTLGKYDGRCHDFIPNRCCPQTEWYMYRPFQISPRIYRPPVSLSRISVKQGNFHVYNLFLHHCSWTLLSGNHGTIGCMQSNNRFALRKVVRALWIWPQRLQCSSTKILKIWVHCCLYIYSKVKS
jgi:hypothetical protein